MSCRSVTREKFMRLRDYCQSSVSRILEAALQQSNACNSLVNLVNVVERSHLLLTLYICINSSTKTVALYTVSQKTRKL